MNDPFYNYAVDMAFRDLTRLQQEVLAEPDAGKRRYLEGKRDMAILYFHLFEIRGKLIRQQEAEQTDTEGD